MMPSMDMNSDIGESFGHWHLGDDTAILQSITSANIACGFHAGDPSTMAATCRAAVAANVAIGAHVAYRDLVGFGRRFVDCTPTELTDDIIYQIGALDAFAKAAGARVRYIKPHGALYNTIVHHETQAQAVIDAVRSYDATLPILALPGSVVLQRAERHGLRGVAEAFADRNYNADGTLVSRREADAIVTDDAIIAANMVRLTRDHVIIARDGSRIAMPAASICVHGDNPAAVQTAAAVRQALTAATVDITRFT